jgi:hypothetical protein
VFVSPLVTVFPFFWGTHSPFWVETTPVLRVSTKGRVRICSAFVQFSWASIADFDQESHSLGSNACLPCLILIRVLKGGQDALCLFPEEKDHHRIFKESFFHEIHENDAFGDHSRAAWY